MLLARAVAALVSPRTWLAVIHHLAGLIIGFPAIFIVAFGVGFGIGLTPAALIGIAVLGITMRFATWFARVERARMAVTLGERIPAWPAAARSGYRWGLVPRLRTLTERATWGEIGYALVRLPVSALGVALSVGVWAAGLVMLTLPAYNAALPRGGAEIGGTVLRGAPTMAVSAVAGVALLLAAPWLARGLATADLALSRRLLAPPTDLAARVAELERSRERVVGAAEAERRRDRA